MRDCEKYVPVTFLKVGNNFKGSRNKWASKGGDALRGQMTILVSCFIHNVTLTMDPHFSFTFHLQGPFENILWISHKVY